MVPQKYFIIHYFLALLATAMPGIAQHEMGPNVLQLTEWLCQHLQLEPGMRVLDLGCGCALSSIFLAREFGLSVVAADLWIAPRRQLAAGLCSRHEKPSHPAARRPRAQLPFAEGYFDAIISIDAYQYFGTDALYLGLSHALSRPWRPAWLRAPQHDSSH